MISSLLSVPPARLEALLADYQREVARRRRQSLLVLAIIAILVAIAGRVGEVDLDNLVRQHLELHQLFRPDHAEADGGAFRRRCRGLVLGYRGLAEARCSTPS